jgi:hypothetical protein
MHVRVVTFTDVTRERIDALRVQVEEAAGPPPGVRATALTVLFDGRQRTAVVLRYFDTEDDMIEGGKAFAAMDPGETSGTRGSVDTCEVAIEVQVA